MNIPYIKTIVYFSEYSVYEGSVRIFKLKKDEIMKLKYIIIICPMYAPDGLICELCNLKQVKVKPSLCPSTEHHDTKQHWGSGGTALHTLAIDEASGQPHTPATPPPRKKPQTPIGGWAGPRAGQDIVIKRKISEFPPGLELPIIQPTTQHYTTKLS
jgi:hypothetical protein